MNHCTMICDMQFGSTGKGLIAGYIAERDQPDTVITAWMPNAGHTYIDANGRKFVHTMLANGVVSPKLKRIMIAPASVINLDSLLEEIESCLDLMDNVAIIIHKNAMMVSEEHRQMESGGMTAIGSTKKGCGAALIQKIQRNPDKNDTAGMRGYGPLHLIEDKLGVSVEIVDTTKWLWHINKSDRVLIEGAQGYSLGINAGLYPYTTSRECTPSQIASDCLISLRDVDKIIGCMRTFPIRVANRFDQEGTMIGYSGPCYDDQVEIDWKILNVPPEKTTVTQLTRRVFTFSDTQARQAIQICRPDEIFLNFVNYLDPNEIATAVERIDRIQPEQHLVRYLGNGPLVTDVVDLHDPNIEAPF